MGNDEYQLEPDNYIWACANGHEFVFPSDNVVFMTMTFVGLDGEKIEKKVPVCPFCYADWILAHVAELKCMGRMDEA